MISSQLDVARLDHSGVILNVREMLFCSFAVKRYLAITNNDLLISADRLDGFLYAFLICSLNLLRHLR